MEPKKTHKEIALRLRELFGGGAEVFVYKDNRGGRPVPVGEFGKGTRRFYSTIGSFETRRNIPPGSYEFCAMGKHPWLPNALASSLYWLLGRECAQWPLVCEDVIQVNSPSIYRHMAYAPSGFSMRVSSGEEIRWLLGIPLKDREISITFEETRQRCLEIYPDWLTAWNKDISEDTREH